MARDFIRAVHYSGKVDTRSQFHIGVFWAGRLEGAMQFGPSIDKHRSVGLVTGTGWNDFIELHRLAFSEKLPRNSESRALGIALRLLRKRASHVDWVLSYADATQCGDGTIYRASGFELIGIKKNTQMYRLPDGSVHHSMVFDPGFSPNAKGGNIKAKYGKTGSEPAGVFLKRIGAAAITGFQLKYIYFLNKATRANLTVPVLPFSAIAEAGAAMYKGQPRAGGAEGGTPSYQLGGGGSTPTSALSLANRITDE